METGNKFVAVLRMIAVAALGVMSSVASHDVRAQLDAPTKTSPRGDSSSETKGKASPKAPSLPEPAGARRLDPNYPVWIDMNEKAVLVDGQIALREGMLEMFACTRNTKEHESIVSANTKAYLVHAGLLRLGAEPGHPAQFQPQYKAPTGAEIDVLIRWVDEKGKPHEARAQDWIMDLHTKKPMTYPFVFGGSGFWKDPDTGKQHYQAEGGDFVCVSNFGTAMLDIPWSSQSNDELEFKALTEKIPPLGAPVRLVFKPKLKKVEGAGGKVEGKKSAGKSAKAK